MVKCAECGFLASRGIQSRRLDETEQEIRSEGIVVPIINLGKPFNVYEPPICFMCSADYKAVPFTMRINPSTKDPEAQAVRTEIQRERTCELFTLWKLGSTPKEHREMLDRQWMIDREDARDGKARNMRIVELVLVIITITAIVASAFIGRGSQTVNIITPDSSDVTIEQ